MSHFRQSYIAGFTIFAFSLLALLYSQRFFSASTTSSFGSTFPDMPSSATMRAIVMHAPGAPSVLKVVSIPRPTASAGHILIRVKAFGINRSEVFTRQGHSPGVSFPRVLGIEATGIVESAPGSSHFVPGDVVVTAMGGMGRAFDGGYAEYTVVPAGQVLKIKGLKQDEVDWKVLGALPELFQTAYGALTRSLQLQRGDKLLVRGATSGVGLAAIALAKEKGVFVVGTTRNESRTNVLREVGTDDVIIDKEGGITEEVRKKFPGGFSKIFELVGVTTLDDSLKCAAESGTVCMSGITGGKWTYDSFNPMMSIPTTIRLTTYGGSSNDLLKTPIEDIYQKIVAGTMQLPIKVFQFEEIEAVHELMEFSGAVAKMVVLVG